MDWKELAASVIENLAWPATVLVIFFLVREKVGQLIEKLGKLKYKDLELDFSKIKQQTSAVEVTENEAKKTDSVAIKDSDSVQVFSSLEEQIFEAVENSPAAAVLLAWSYIEASISSAISRLKLHAGAPLQNIQKLESSGRLSPQQLELLHEMRVLRNKLAHDLSGEIVIHTEQALDYAGTAVELARFLDGLDRKRKIFMLPHGDWVTIPKGFSEPKERSANFWKYSCVDVPGTNLKAGVGPWSSGLEGNEILYFGIDIEQPRDDGSSVIAELLVDLDHVSKEKLDLDARQIVSFDEANRVVRFDLGNSVFEYQLK